MSAKDQIPGYETLVDLIAERFGDSEKDLEELESRRDAALMRIGGLAVRHRRAHEGFNAAMREAEKSGVDEHVFEADLQIAEETCLKGALDDALNAYMVDFDGSEVGAE